MWITVTNTKGCQMDVNFSLVSMISSVGDKSFLISECSTITIDKSEHDRIREILGIKNEQ